MKHLKIFEKFSGRPEYKRCTRVNVDTSFEYVEKFGYDKFTQFEIDYIKNGIFKKFEMEDRIRKNSGGMTSLYGETKETYVRRENGDINPKVIIGLDIHKLGDEWFLVDFHVIVNNWASHGIFKYIVDGLEGLDELYNVFFDIDTEIRSKKKIWIPEG